MLFTNHQNKDKVPYYPCYLIITVYNDETQLFLITWIN